MTDSIQMQDRSAKVFEVWEIRLGELGELGEFGGFDRFNLPPHKVVGVDMLGPGELPEDDVVVAFDDLPLVDVVLPQQREGVRHVGAPPFRPLRSDHSVSNGAGERANWRWR